MMHEMFSYRYFELMWICCFACPVPENQEQRKYYKNKNYMMYTLTQGNKKIVKLLRNVDVPNKTKEQYNDL